METILCAAIYYPNEKTPVHGPVNVTSGLVLNGWRHAHIVSQFSALTGRRTAVTEHVQGFLTSKNRFLNREDAYDVAVQSGQFKNPPYILSGRPHLYSEDLY